MCFMVLKVPFTKTLCIDFPPLPLWHSLSELSEMLPPKLQSSFCPKQNLILSSQVVHLFSGYMLPNILHLFLFVCFSSSTSHFLEKWEHIVCVFICLSYFTYFNTFYVQEWCKQRQDFILWLSNISSCTASVSWLLLQWTWRTYTFSN